MMNEKKENNKEMEINFKLRWSPEKIYREIFVTKKLLFAGDGEKSYALNLMK